MITWSDRIRLHHKIETIVSTRASSLEVAGIYRRLVDFRNSHAAHHERGLWQIGGLDVDADECDPAPLYLHFLPDPNRVTIKAITRTAAKLVIAGVRAWICRGEQTITPRRHRQAIGSRTLIVGLNKLSDRARSGSATFGLAQLQDKPTQYHKNLNDRLQLGGDRRSTTTRR